MPLYHYSYVYLTDLFTWFVFTWNESKIFSHSPPRHAASVTTVKGWTKIAAGHDYLKVDPATKKLRAASSLDEATSFYASSVQYNCRNRTCKGFTLRHWLRDAQGGTTAYEITLDVDPSSATPATNFRTISSVPLSQLGDNKAVVLAYDEERASLEFVAHTENGGFKMSNAAYTVATSSGGPGAIQRVCLLIFVVGYHYDAHIHW